MKIENSSVGNLITVSFSQQDFRTGVAKDAIAFIKKHCRWTYRPFIKKWKFPNPGAENMQRLQRFADVNDLSKRVCYEDCPKEEMLDFDLALRG